MIIALDGPSGLALARQFRPEVALLDIGLPKMNGYELAQRIREEPSLDGTLLIAVTGYGQMHDRARASASGFHHHLVKPVEFGALQQLLREHLLAQSMIANGLYDEGYLVVIAPVLTISETMRSRSSAEPNSTTIFPRRLPISTRTLV